MKETVFCFTAGDNEPRLDRFLQEEFETVELGYPVTRSNLKKLIEAGAVTDSKGNPRLKSSDIPKKGEIFTVCLPEPKNLSAQPEDIPIEIVYENENFAVVNKQKGLVVHPCETATEHTLVNALLFRLKDLSDINGVIRPGIVHRLDKDTSGLLVVAKNNMAHLSLQNQIAEKTAERKYLAILDGNLKNDEGVIDAPIGRDPKNRLRMAVRKDGRRAVTHYKVIERFGTNTLTEFVLETGRTHQIRAHARELKHPVTGDVLYGGSGNFKTTGQLLHAYSLSIDEPLTGERMTFTAEPPEEFVCVFELLRKKR